MTYYYKYNQLPPQRTPSGQKFGPVIAGIIFTKYY